MMMVVTGEGGGGVGEGGAQVGAGGGGRESGIGNDGCYGGGKEEMVEKEEEEEEMVEEERSKWWFNYRPLNQKKRWHKKDKNIRFRSTKKTFFAAKPKGNLIMERKKQNKTEETQSWGGKTMCKE